MGVNVLLPGAAVNLCWVGVGVPVTVAEIRALSPETGDATTTEEIAGAEPLTVRVAAELVAVPRLLVNTARYRVPVLAVVRAPVVYVVDVAPLMLTKLLLPGSAFCHWMLGAGFPNAAALNDAVAPDVTVAA
jgi:hypothetical protein